MAVTRGTKSATNERKVRMDKRTKMLKDGVTPYPSYAHRTHLTRAARTLFDSLASHESEITVAGRIRALRSHGGSIFATIEDATGTLQLYFKKDVLGASFSQFHTLADVGDFLECKGVLFKTHAGEETLRVQSFRMLAKSLEPLPEKWHGLLDTEVRYRRRELDFIANKEMRAIIAIRAALLKTLRVFLDQEGFLEVETPILQPVAGGATARPFLTRHNALQADFYLRIAPELYLKRLVVGGFEKIYEIGRVFRNEGIDRSHNPEFSMLELYHAYQDYRGLMDLVERLLVALESNVLGGASVPLSEGHVSISLPIPRLHYDELVLQHTGIDIVKLNDRKKFSSALKNIGITVPDHFGLDKMIDELFKEKVRPSLQKFTFVIDHPAVLSPLAKVHSQDPERAERFQLFANGMELINGFSEENDPVEQRRRFEVQESLRRQGDDEAQLADEEFIRSL